ncbi:ATP-dependent DNA helicase PIF1-like [Papaver somniferum]|uniref:ATP-dependent DNA helicase PIF1-like n=1 Tax=Papaver somniferum TaxID=3469 RepID=UPI000E6FBCEE|nr:ATP-dependent DNA helicase PIF1-like [Papaver somniferum]
MTKKHYYARKRWCTFKVEAVVRVLPELGCNIMPNTEKWESFCQQQVLLNSCYRSIVEANRGFNLWSECYADISRGIKNQPIHISTIDDDFEDQSDLEEEPLEDWMMLSSMAPNVAPVCDIELGSRTCDLIHNWSEVWSNYPSKDDDRRFVHILGQAEQEESEEYIPNRLDVPLSSLSPQQKEAHDMVLQSMREGSTIRLIISGGAGTCKSTLINAIVHSTRELFQKIKSVRIMTPTGVDAFNIDSATIHHELALSVDKDQSYKSLDHVQCGHMQKDFKDTKLIVIDEYSMIGRKMFANIDLRCRDIFANNEPFGNVSVVLVGDMRQLPPVFDTPLYVQGGRSKLQLYGSIPYSLFDRCVRLEEVFRQSGNEELSFRDALLRLSDGKSTLTDWELFSARDYSLLTIEEQNKFNHVLRLFHTKSDASRYNHERLKDLGKPVARIISRNNCEIAKIAKSDEANRLQEILLSSKGSRVMLRKNLSTKYGLVNGSRGVVVDIVYKNGEKPPTDMLVVVMVDFDKYTGPKLYPGSNVIPITPQTANRISTSGVTCQRIQLPLILCWAITVHKSQGLTLDQAVVDIGPRESLGLTFVVLSRTRKLRDLAFSPMFAFERIARISTCRGLPLRRKEEERLRELSNATF